MPSAISPYLIHIERDKIVRTNVYFGSTPMQSGNFVTVSNIELATGFSKELLRKWRQRYGFPLLEAGKDGASGYSQESIEQLHLIRRLLDNGFRIAQLAGKPQQELEHLNRGLEVPLPEPHPNQTNSRLLKLLMAIDTSGIERYLRRERNKVTLTQFVLNILGPFITSVGDAWSRNEIEIYHEHLCTCTIQRLLHTEILSCKPGNGSPKVLLSTPPTERHELGLLMVEAVFADHGASTLYLGSSTPINDIKLAALAYGADVVALSFSFAYPARNVQPFLTHLRLLLPSNMEIWAGGSGVSAIKRPPKGVRIFSGIQESVEILQKINKQKGLPEKNAISA